MSSGSYQNTPNPHIGSVGGPVLTNGHCESVPQLDTPNPSPANFGTAATSNNQYSISPQAIADKLHSLAVNNSPSDSPSRSPQRLSESHDNTTPNHEEITPNHEKTTTASHQRVVVMTDEFGIKYEKYQSEHQMADIMKLISDLSEPYSIYTYRYFIHNWPNLCFLAHDESDGYIGAIVCKLDQHKRTSRSRGYIAMLAVHGDHRRKRIGSKLVGLAIDVMMSEKCDEIVLETECTNLAALNLYERLGFIRDKRLYKYYLNGVDAFRLKLWVT